MYRLAYSSAGVCGCRKGGGFDQRTEAPLDSRANTEAVRGFRVFPDLGALMDEEIYVLLVTSG